MSDTESLIVRLEDGEIDESNEPSVLPEPLADSNTAKDLRVQNDDRPPSAVFDGSKCSGQKRRQSSEEYNSEKVYLNDQEIVYMDEDEMLCVRGASPVPYVVDRLSYSRKSPLQDCETISFDTSPPKRRRTSGKRRRKRTTPRKILKDKSLSPDELNEQGNSNSNEINQSPDEIQDKLPQVCKFYLQDCCAKRFKCEYMHSEFPCKFYYLGLKCEDETSETGCKLSHGGSLSAEMLNALARHINTAPVDVLGQEFIGMRSKMQVAEMNQMLQDTQNNLTPPKNFQKKIFSPQNDSSKFFVTLKEKLYFLNEDQLNGLKKLEITKVDDLLNLTLAQLNAIGIHATQIEAIQMSFVAGKDTDMRNILPTQLEVPNERKIPSFEVVCYNDETTCGQNWYEQEEGPLVIDETNDADDDENENKTPEDDDILIDVVGDSHSDSYSSVIEEDIDKVKHELAVVSTPDNTEQSQHFVIEETKEGIQVHPNSMVFVNKSPPAECLKSISEINLDELEILQKSEDDAQFDENSKKHEVRQTSVDLQDEIEFSKIQDEAQLDENGEELEILKTSEDLQDKIECSKMQVEAQLDENRKKLEVLQTSEDLQDEIECSKMQDEAQLDENRKKLEVLQTSEEFLDEIEFSKDQDESQLDEKRKELEVLPTSEDLQDEIECSKIQDEVQVNEIRKELEVLQTSEEIQEESLKNQNDSQLDKNKEDATEDFSVFGNMIEKQIDIETLKDEEKQSYILSPKKEIKHPNIPQEEEQTQPVPLELKEGKSTPPPIPIKSPKENRRMCSTHSENVIAEIDLTVKTPPRRSTDSHLPERRRDYINPFQRKNISPDNETKRRYSPMKEQVKKYMPQPNFKQDHQMQGDNSSEDWDADERSDIQSPPKEIASPDQSEDESTPFVADGTCPELPRRTRNLDNYQPALEINAHLTYPPMEYKLYEIYMPQYEVNKPTLMEKLLKANSTDPRLKKFIEKEKNHGVFPQAEYSFFPPNIPQCDPRLRPGTGTSCQEQQFNASRVLYSYLQRSQWYQELKSNLKIQINHSVSDLVRALNFFHKDPAPQKIFDLFQIECAGVLLEVMRNVGIFIDANGNITEEANYKQLCAPLQPQQPHQPPQSFASECIGPNTKPGLLGFAPPGVTHPHQNNSPMSSESSFARQAFGHDCMCSNNNNDFQPIGPSFYVGGRYPMNRNQEPGFDPGFEPAPYQRQNQKRNFKRR